MISFVFLIWSSLIISTITSNPVPALQPPIYQQSEFKNPPVAYRKDASQTNPYSQHVTVQNQPPSQRLNDGSINQLLMSKILSSPCLQKILDPNTKLYNQNGQEIQRQPKTGTTPSVINNYFIVPPEFFNLNNSQSIVKSKKVPRKRKILARKKAKAKTKSNFEESGEKFAISDDFETSKRNESNGRNKKGEKRNKNRKSAKLIAEDVELDIKKEAESEQEVKKTKKRRKSGSSTKTESMVATSPSTEAIDDNLQKDEILKSENNNKSKKRKKSKTSSNTMIDGSDSSLDIDEPTAEIEDVSSRNKKVTPAHSAPETNEEKIGTVNVENSSHLKNIELPVDNSDTRDLKENCNTKPNKEKRKIRNSKPERTKQTQTQKVVTPEEMIRNFLPYMYMGSNFYPNANYPFNLEQFFKPHINGNNRKRQKTKKKNSQKQQNDKESPKVVKVKVKSNKEVITTTANPLSEEKDVLFYNERSETTTLPSEPETTILEETPHEAFLEESVEEDLKLDIPKKESVITKSNLEMPPTFIEDLHEYITPELGREDIVPTIYTNGLINDYYPVFYDDAYSTDDESYYLKDFEDDRHFYTTDRGEEILLNRDRRKYDRIEDYRRPNLDIKDRINFRRGKYGERLNNEGNSISRRNHEKIVESDKSPRKTQNVNEVHFQTPPSLENPDFRTKKMEKQFLKSDIESHEAQGPIYTDSREISDYDTFSEINPLQFSRLLNDPGTEKEKVVQTIAKPRNDRVETVFAKTRVVKYGAVKESEENASTSMSNENDDENEYSGNDHTTYVIAKSLGHVDNYW